MDKQRLMSQLEIDEGRRDRVYTDTVGKLTVGVGRNISDRAFSKDEIDLMLSNDIKIVEATLDKNTPWWRQMSTARQNVLANMCFNMGWSTLSTFKNTLKAMQDGRYADAAQGMMDSKWSKQVGKRAERLRDLMLRGEF
jgi:lysozyme